MSAAPLQLKRLSFNALLQIGGQVVPLLVGVAALPFLRDNLGDAGFGAFSVALSVLGLFALLDLGLGRATVRFVARALERNDVSGAAAVTVQSALLLGAAALAICVILVLAAAPLAEHWFHSGEISQRVLRHSLYILAVALPFIALTTVLRSILEAHEDFTQVGVLQGAIGAATYLAPLATSFFTNEVTLVIASATLCRIAGTAAFFSRIPRAWWREARRSIAPLHWDRDFRSFSFWLVISNLAGVCIVYGDRALLVGTLPLEQVPFYNVPLEMLVRVLIVVNGAVTVLFPRLARTDQTQNFDRYHAVALIGSATLLAPLLLLLGATAPIWLELWLGADFALHSTTLVRLFLVGILFQALNAVAFAALNALGRARVPAFMHLVELPLYFTALYLAGERLGLVGLALVWSVRPIVEYLCFTALLLHEVPPAARGLRLLGGAFAATSAVPVIVIAAFDALSLAVVVCVLITAVSAAWLARMTRALRPA